MSLKRADCIYEEIILEADWWLPNDNSSKFRGKLSGSVVDGFRLAIEGAFSLVEEGFSETEVILGESRTGKKYTLLKNYCLSTNRSINLKNPTSIKKVDTHYHVSWLLVGEHFNNYDDLMFHNISFGISNFEEWHLIKAFDEEYNGNDNSIDGLSVTYNQPEPVKILSDDYVNATIEYSYSHSGINLSQTSYSIDIRAEITIRAVDQFLRLHDFDEKSDISFSKYMHKIVSFIEFATQRQAYSFDIKVCSKENPYEDLQNISEPIAVYYHDKVSPEVEKPIKNYEMLFTWRHIKDAPQKHFQAWVDNIDLIGMPIWLYLGSYRKFTYEDQKFMELAQGLEGFHRYRFPEASESSEDHQIKIKSILDNFPDVYYEWLNGKMMHSHEPTLRKRLKELCNEQDEIVSWLTNTKKTRNRVIGLIVDNRNQYAHCLSLDTGTVTINLRFNLNRFMQFVFAALLLNETKFTNEQILEIFKDNWICQQVPKVLNEALSLNDSKENI